MPLKYRPVRRHDDRLIKCLIDKLDDGEFIAFHQHPLCMVTRERKEFYCFLRVYFEGPVHYRPVGTIINNKFPFGFVPKSTVRLVYKPQLNVVENWALRERKGKDKCPYLYPF